MMSPGTEGLQVGSAADVPVTPPDVLTGLPVLSSTTADAWNPSAAGEFSPLMFESEGDPLKGGSETEGLVRVENQDWFGDSASMPRVRDARA